MTQNTPGSKPSHREIAEPIQHVFVYGTLKRGQCRSGLWPAKPIEVMAGWTLGVLMGRADYPAMIAGGDRVFGEIWHFQAEAMPAVFRVLDQIEGFNQPGQPDLYVRVEVATYGMDDRPIAQASTYLYAVDPTIDGFRRMSRRDGEDFVRWP